MVECVTYLRVSKNDGLRERDCTFNSKDMANVNGNAVCSAISSITNSVENQRKLLERFILKNDLNILPSLLMRDIRARILTDRVL